MDVVKYSEYVQRVRSFSRSDLLRGLSAISTRVNRNRVAGQEPRPPAVQEFTLAGVARTSLARGNDHRDRETTFELVARMCSEYIETSYTPQDGHNMGELLRPIYFEQLLVQLSPMYNIARAHALFNDYLPQVKNAPSTAEIENVLGVPTVEDFIRIGFVLHTASMQHEGILPRSLLLSAKVAPMFYPLLADDIMAHLQRHYALHLNEHARRAVEALKKAPNGQEALAFNPLQASPLINMGQDFISPAPHFLVDKFSGTGLFYTLAGALNGKFTDALGHAFEDYVADHLGLLSAPKLQREITFGRDNQKSCDFLMVFNELVLLVEVKSSRPPESFRQSISPAKDLYSLKKAREQLLKTADHISERHEAFAHIPNDRPLRALVVTLEPHLVSGTEAQSEILEGPEGIPILEIFSHDLEDFCGKHQPNAELGQHLLSAWPASGETKFRAFQKIEGGTGESNPIMQYHFSRALGVEKIKNAFL